MRGSELQLEELEPRIMYSAAPVAAEPSAPIEPTPNDAPEQVAYLNDQTNAATAEALVSAPPEPVAQSTAEPVATEVASSPADPNQTQAPAYDVDEVRENLQGLVLVGPETVLQTGEEFQLEGYATLTDGRSYQVTPDIDAVAEIVWDTQHIGQSDVEYLGNGQFRVIGHRLNSQGEIHAYVNGGGFQRVGLQFAGDPDYADQFYQGYEREKIPETISENTITHPATIASGYGVDMGDSSEWIEIDESLGGNIKLAIEAYVGGPEPLEWLISAIPSETINPGEAGEIRLIAKARSGNFYDVTDFLEVADNFSDYVVDDEKHPHLVYNDGSYGETRFGGRVDVSFLYKWDGIASGSFHFQVPGAPVANPLDSQTIQDLTILVDGKPFDPSSGDLSILEKDDINIRVLADYGELGVHDVTYEFDVRNRYSQDFSGEQVQVRTSSITSDQHNEFITLSYQGNGVLAQGVNGAYTIHLIIRDHSDAYGGADNWSRPVVEIPDLTVLEEENQSETEPGATVGVVTSTSQFRDHGRPLVLSSAVGVRNLNSSEVRSELLQNAERINVYQQYGVKGNLDGRFKTLMNIANSNARIGAGDLSNDVNFKTYQAQVVWTQTQFEELVKDQRIDGLKQASRGAYDAVKDWMLSLAETPEDIVAMFNFFEAHREQLLRGEIPDAIIDGVKQLGGTIQHLVANLPLIWDTLSASEQAYYQGYLPAFLTFEAFDPIKKVTAGTKVTSLDKALPPKLISLVTRLNTFTRVELFEPIKETGAKVDFDVLSNSSIKYKKHLLQSLDKGGVSDVDRITLERVSKIGDPTEAKKIQEHHFLSNKHGSRFTAEFEDVLDKHKHLRGLNLKGDWNKGFVYPHLASHDDAYHGAILDNVRAIAAETATEADFLGRFDAIKRDIASDPAFWLIRNSN